MSLYLWINLLSIIIPLIASFHPRIRFHLQWKHLIPAILLSMVPYIIWDIYFTRQGIWGFNPEYLSSISLIGLPLEEWLFFLCIPYACVFTHYCMRLGFKNLRLQSGITNGITFLLIFVFGIILVLHYNLAYTSIDMIFALTILLLTHFSDRSLLRSYYISFLIILIPFLLVNGILTGSGIPEQVVWYNNTQNLGIRLFTIPIEDVAYAFSLILLNLLVFRKLGSNPLRSSRISSDL